jgi:hypothetical protein
MWEQSYLDSVNNTQTSIILQVTHIPQCVTFLQEINKASLKTDKFTIAADEFTRL